MNIGLFTDTYFPQLSGVATSIQTLKNSLEADGHSVFIFTTTDPHLGKGLLSQIFSELVVYLLSLLRIEELQLEVYFRQRKLLRK